MNERIDVEATLAKFREWLEDARAQAEALEALPPGPDSEPGGSVREFGFIDLIEEFTALRHELKLQTKSARGLIDQNDNSVATLRQALDQLRAVEVREAQSAWTIGKAMAEALADLDEALTRGQREIERARSQIADESVRDLETSLDQLFRRQPWIRRRFLRLYHQQVKEAVRRDGSIRHELFESFIEGFGLIQRRLRRALSAEQIAHIACDGQPVDPERMTVIELVDEPRDRPGTVARELRRGYTWRGRVIRFAEVQAVRTAMKSADAAENENEDDNEAEVEMDLDELDVTARSV